MNTRKPLKDFSDLITMSGEELAKFLADNK